MRLRIIGRIRCSPVAESGEYRGALLAESMRVDATITVPPAAVTKIYRMPAGDPEAGQPKDWTFIEFSLPRAFVQGFVEALSRSLIEGPWYCDFHSDAEVVVVFANGVFRYPPADKQSRQEVEEYGRSVGVPEAQLDWPE